ncbi:hypothetical protein PVAND_006998 [Polypedilum vanderplanki]|uniref:Uncharacterized protein n=1 Tax=Polypedilum vanderplanki TaxID=319348 RepID=A0A9J6C6J4_POLVA|nr:hypothetical protein PVAND_006998 [Polypedilum vanderplanki]
MLVERFFGIIDVEIGLLLIGLHCYVKLIFKRNGAKSSHCRLYIPYNFVTNYESISPSYDIYKDLRYAAYFLIINLAFISFLVFWLFKGLMDVNDTKHMAIN